MGLLRNFLNFGKVSCVPRSQTVSLIKRSIGRASWEYLRTFNRDIADAERARKFWSIFEFAFTPRGVTNLYNSIPQMGSKFLNPFTDFLPWWKYDYTPPEELSFKIRRFSYKDKLRKRTTKTYSHECRY